jgi:hypothetical protein
MPKRKDHHVKSAHTNGNGTGHDNGNDDNDVQHVANDTPKKRGRPRHKAKDESDKTPPSPMTPATPSVAPVSVSVPAPVPEPVYYDEKSLACEAKLGMHYTEQT